MISDADLLDQVRPASEDELPHLRRLEKSAIALVQKKAGKYFGVADAIVEVLYRNGSLLALNSDAPDGLTTLESWDGSAWSAIDATTYTVDGRYVRFAGTSLTAVSPTRYRATYNGGYADAGGDEWEAPENIKQAVRLYISHWYENREGESTPDLERAVRDLIDVDTRVAF